MHAPALPHICADAPTLTIERFLHAFLNFHTSVSTSDSHCHDPREGGRAEGGRGDGQARRGAARVTEFAGRVSCGIPCRRPRRRASLAPQSRRSTSAPGAGAGDARLRTAAGDAGDPRGPVRGSRRAHALWTARRWKHAGRRRHPTRLSPQFFFFSSLTAAARCRTSTSGQDRPRAAGQSGGPVSRTTDSRRPAGLRGLGWRQGRAAHNPRCARAEWPILVP